MARSFLKFFLLLFTFCISPYTTRAQNKLIDSLGLAFKTAKSDTARASILIALSDAISFSNTDTMIPLCKRALEIIDKNIDKANPAEKRSFLATRAYAFNNLGFVLSQKGDAFTGLDYHKKSLALMQELDDKEGIAMSYNNIGTIYESLGDIQKALDYYHNGLRIQEETGYKLGMAFTLLNIGLIYQNQEDFTKALDYYHRSLKIEEETKNKQGIGYALNNIAQVYQKQAYLLKDSAGKAELFKKALDYNLKSLGVRKEIHDIRGIATSLTSIGALYLAQRDMKNGLHYYQESLKMMEACGEKRGIASLLNNLGGLYLKLAIEAEPSSKKQNLRTAEDYCRRSLEMAKELGYPANIREAAFDLSKIYKEQKEGMKALEYFELYTHMKDSMNNSETQKASIKQHMQYEFAQKEAATRAQQEKKDAIMQGEKQKEKVIRYSISGMLLLVAVFTLFLFNRFRLIRTQKKLIEEQKLQVENKQLEILDSIRYAERIQNSLLPTDKFIEKTVERLRNASKS